MESITCIVCPNGCEMKKAVVDGVVEIVGNKCKRGIEFFIEEETAPKRTFSTTVRTAFKACPALPVRVSSPIPKDKIFDCIKELSKVIVEEKLGVGDTVIENVCGLGVDVICVSNVLIE